MNFVIRIRLGPPLLGGLRRALENRPNGSGPTLN